MYKRQVFLCTALNVVAACSQRQSVQPVAEAAVHVSIGALVYDVTLKDDGVEAVSYTHLDVYKRQPWRTPLSRLSGSRPPKSSFPLLKRTKRKEKIPL